VAARCRGKEQGAHAVGGAGAVDIERHLARLQDIVDQHARIHAAARGVDEDLDRRELVLACIIEHLPHAVHREVVVDLPIHLDDAAAGEQRLQLEQLEPLRTLLHDIHSHHAF